MKDTFKVITLAIGCALLSGCASLFGNIGPVEISCTDKNGANFEFTLPQGSGRVYDGDFVLGPEHPCGPLTIPAPKQGEDRSSGILGIFSLIFGRL